jgi:hypothetical protein
MRKRFTIDGSDTLETHLARVCEEVKHAVTEIVPASQMEAILLGGGYGRGEGGVLKTLQGDKPYNDLEFYVLIQGSTLLNERKFRSALHEAGEKLSKLALVEVEFKITSAEKLQRGPVTMFLYDLAMGHRIIFGSADELTSARFTVEHIPRFEATRLLMNRCSGLLFSEQRLRKQMFTNEDADFVGRNQAKAQLGFGDVILTAMGQYHWSCRERNSRLKNLISGPKAVQCGALPLQKLLCHHALGVDFKLHPQKKCGGPDAFAGLQVELCELGKQLWLWLESLRLDIKFCSTRDYVFSPSNKCPETNAAKNLAINLRRFGFTGLGTRYPRERLLHALPLLLWERGTLHDPVLLKRAQRELNTHAGRFERLVPAYQAIWRDFN